MIGRERTCCFTGHRPEKLPWGSDETDPRCIALKKRLRDAVELAYESGMRRFICGMARGCDFYFAETVLAMREMYPDIELFAAIPCLSQCRRWPDEDQVRWHQLLDACDHKELVQERYTRGCMMRRNRYMVDHSSLLIAVYDGLEGGTRETLSYAMRKKISFMDISVDG